jgi:hypothetical protein
VIKASQVYLIIVTVIVAACDSESKNSKELLPKVLDQSTQEDVSNHINSMNFDTVKKIELSDSTISLKDSITTNDSLSYQESYITYDGSLYHKSQLIHSFNINNNHFQLFSNLVNPDTSKDFSWSASSLSVYKNNKEQTTLYTEDLTRQLADLEDGSTNEINATTLYGDETKQVIRIDMNQYPSAPGIETISLIQFKETQIKHSKQYNITGKFINSNKGVDGVAWSGYFAFELPFKLIENNNDLNLEIDTSNLHMENGHYYLNVKDGIKFASGDSELNMTDNPFSNNPSIIKVNLKPKTRVTLIQIAVDQIDNWDYLYKNNWIKIKINDKEGWIKSDKDLMKIGCQAAG